MSMDNIESDSESKVWNCLAETIADSPNRTKKMLGQRLAPNIQRGPATASTWHQMGQDWKHHGQQDMEKKFCPMYPDTEEDLSKKLDCTPVTVWCLCTTT